MLCSTVIATYNRSKFLARAVQSALNTLPQCEVVVVDDASTDDTLSRLKQDFAGPLSSGQLKLVALESNQGVTGAKNAGYEVARGDWVVFLDSDDWYQIGVGDRLEAELKASQRSPIVFFRCVDQSGQLVGQRQGETFYIDLHCYLRQTSFGEALTAVNKALVGNKPPYVALLRGYEGLGCARLIDRYGDALLSSLVARVYDQSGDDRLSRSMVRRMPLLARGHFMLLKEFWPSMPLHQAVGYLVKLSIYFLVGGVAWLVRKKSA